MYDSPIPIPDSASHVDLSKQQILQKMSRSTQKTQKTGVMISLSKYFEDCLKVLAGRVRREHDWRNLRWSGA